MIAARTHIGEEAAVESRVDVLDKGKNCRAISIKDVNLKFAVAARRRAKVNTAVADGCGPARHRTDGIETSSQGCRAEVIAAKDRVRTCGECRTVRHREVR